MQIQETQDQETYEQLWQEQKLHTLQSWVWGEVKRGEYLPVRLGFMENEQMLFVISLQVKSLNFPRLKFAYIPKLLLTAGREQEILNLLSTYAKERLHLDFILLEFAYQEKDLPQVLKSLASHPYSIQPKQTNQIKVPGADLWLQMKGNYRRNIKKAEKDGVIILTYTTGSEAIDSFYQVMLEVFQNTKYLARSKNYFARVWELLSAEGKAKIFLAKYQEQIVGGYLVVYDEVGAYELYGGVTRQGRDLEAGYLLKYQAMLDAQKSGKAIYDHWGVAPKLTDGSYERKHELYNISLFKEGFGGEYVEFPKVRIVSLNKTKYKFFKLLQKINQFTIKLRKLFN